MPRPRNALVFDWDYFFPNPMATAYPDDDLPRDVFMYDWTTSEHGNAERLPPYIWQTRAEGFLSWDLPLPYCTGWEQWWDRFPGIAVGAELTYADSNAYSAPEHFAPAGSGTWDRIDLYDAHHDAGYHHRPESDCGNWMVDHYRAGVRNLNVHYPAWRRTVDGVEPPPHIPVKRDLDDGTSTVRKRYDAVFVCRSGAWVPSWCDGQFEQFLAAAPAHMPRVLAPGSAPVERREFDLAASERGANLTKIQRRHKNGFSSLVEAVRIVKSGGDTTGMDAQLLDDARAMSDGGLRPL